MSARGGLMAPVTAKIDIRSQPTTGDPYGNRDDLAELLAMRKMPEIKIREAATLYATELTSWDGMAREVTTISARAAITELLVLLAKGWRQFTITQFADLTGISDRTARRALQQLASRPVGILWVPKGGRGKWGSGTTYSLSKSAVAHLAALLDRGKQWADRLRNARFTLMKARDRRSPRSAHAAKTAGYIGNGTKGGAYPAPPPLSSVDRAAIRAERDALIDARIAREAAEPVSFTPAPPNPRLARVNRFAAEAAERRRREHEARMADFIAGE